MDEPGQLLVSWVGMETPNPSSLGHSLLLGARTLVRAPCVILFSDVYSLKTTAQSGTIAQGMCDERVGRRLLFATLDASRSVGVAFRQVADGLNVVRKGGVSGGLRRSQSFDESRDN